MSHANAKPWGLKPLNTEQKFALELLMSPEVEMVSLVGVPGIYFHSLFGSRGWPEGAALTGRSRTINRQKLPRADLERELADPGSLRFVIFQRYSALLRARSASPAFDPYGSQQVLDGGPGVFALLRTAGDARVLCLQNVSDQPFMPALDSKAIFGQTKGVRDIITGAAVSLDGPLTMAPYQSLWLT